MQSVIAPVPAGSNLAAVARSGAAGRPGSYLIQVSISARCGQHFGICFEYLWRQLVPKSYVT